MAPICGKVVKRGVFFALHRDLYCASFSTANFRLTVNEEQTRLKYFEIPKINPTANDDLRDFNFGTHILKPWADRQPNQVALCLTDGTKTTRLTYSDFFNQSRHLASSLIHRNSPPPKCSLVVLPKIAPWWIINLAASWCDMILSPGTSMLAEKDVLYRVSMAKADTIFCDTSIMEKIDKSTQKLKWRILTEDSKEKELASMREGWLSYHQLVEEGKSLAPVQIKYDGDSVAQLFFTSGTTGHPKMVAHTQRGYGLGQVATSRDWLNLQPSDLLWNISDLGWAKAAFSSLYAPLIAGCTIFAHQMERFDARTVLRVLEEYPVSAMCAPPTAMRAIVQEDLSSFRPKALKLVASAGEPLNPEVVNTWYKNTGIWIREGYGQTECTLVCSSSNGVTVKPGSMGKQNHPYILKVLDEDLEEVGPNIVGQLALSLHGGKPTGLFKGYPTKEQNDKVFVGGYFLTGDKAFIDEDGYVCYVGRADDIIISAGYRIGPYEVESALIEHPAVAESAVVASPDYQRGHVVKAFIILNEEYKVQSKTEGSREKLKREIQEFVKKTIAPYKYPRRIEFVESLPKTVSGKIRRVELRKGEEMKHENMKLH